MASGKGVVMVRGRRYIVVWRSTGAFAGYQVYNFRRGTDPVLQIPGNLVKKEHIAAQAISAFRAHVLEWFAKNPGPEV